MNGTVRPMSSGQMRDIVATLIGAIPDLSHEEAQLIIGNKGSIIKDVRSVFDEFLVGPKKLWRTLTVGEMSQEEILKQLSSPRFKVKVWANRMVEDERFYVSNQVGEMKLCLVSVKELGFSEEPNINDIYARAREFNLYWCPPEVGPLLWMLPDANRGFNIAMDPVSDGDGMRIFYLGPDWLHSEPADTTTNKKWRLGTRFVFIMSDS